MISPLLSRYVTLIAIVGLTACNGERGTTDETIRDTTTQDTAVGADTTFGFVAFLPPCDAIPDRIKSPPAVTVSVVADTIALDKQPVLVCGPGNPLLRWRADPGTVDSFFVVFPDSTPMVNGAVPDTLRSNPNGVAGGPVNRLGWFKYDVHVWPAGQDTMLVRDPDSVILPGGR